MKTEDEALALGVSAETGEPVTVDASPAAREMAFRIHADFRFYRDGEVPSDDMWLRHGDCSVCEIIMKAPAVIQALREVAEHLAEGEKPSDSPGSGLWRNGCGGGTHCR